MVKENKIWINHLLLLFIGFTLFGFFVYLNGVDNFCKLGCIEIVALGCSLIATIGITGSVAYRWGILANAVAGHRTASWLDYYHYVIISRILSFIFPKDVSDIVGRSVLLKRTQNLNYTYSGVSVILDRWFDLLLSLTLLCATIPYWIGIVSVTVGIGLMFISVVVMGGLLFYSYKPFLNGLLKIIEICFLLLNRLPWFKQHHFKPYSFSNIDRELFIWAYLISLIKFSCTVGRFILYTKVLNLSISPALIILGTPLGQLAFLFAFTPGGLGIFEAGWYIILSFGKIVPEIAISFVVGQRILTVTFIGVLALISQILYIIRYHLYNRR